MATILFFGFLVGMRHALEADHVAAVATLASRSSSLRQSLRLGFAWGLGHSATLFAVGFAVLLVDGVVPVEIARWLEGLVGVMLVFLGADVIRRMLRDRVHFHSHRHGSVLHFHAHSHREGRHGVGRPHDDTAHDHQHPRGLSGRALIVGLVHGLAGSAALVLLTLEAMESLWMGLAYMALFGVGSILGMAVLSCAIALPLRLAAKRATWAYNGLTAALGLFTIGLGFKILIALTVV
jgi:ABC-type nickel/cobalt efflux system permease component RcnA